MNTRIVEAIAESFVDFTISIGGNQKFLGMDIEFLGNGRISLFMKDYIEEYIASFIEDLDA